MAACYALDRRVWHENVPVHTLRATGGPLSTENLRTEALWCQYPVYRGPLVPWWLQTGPR